MLAYPWHRPKKAKASPGAARSKKRPRPSIRGPKYASRTDALDKARAEAQAAVAEAQAAHARLRDAMIRMSEVGSRSEMRNAPRNRRD